MSVAVELHMSDISLSFLLQRDGDPSKRNNVVIALQDMLEIVTRDMMVNEIGLVNSVPFLDELFR